MTRTVTVFSALRCVLLLLAVALVSGTQVFAQQGPPPSFSKVFQPDTIGPGSTTTLVFTINNAEGGPVTALAFTDVLPSEITIADPASASTTCGAGNTLTAPDGGGTISLSDGTVGAGATCTVSVNVTSSTPGEGPYTNITGDLTSSAGNSGTATDDLMVDADLPGFSKSFAPSSVPLGSRSTLTFTIDNTANGSQAIFLSFTDNLPLGIKVANPTNVSNTCADGSFTRGVVTAEPGTSVISLSPGNGSEAGAVAAGATCTVSVDVVATGSGIQKNVSDELTSLNSTTFLTEFSGFATATLEVTQTTVALIKEFVDDPVPPGGTVPLKFTIRNFDRGSTASNIAFADTLSKVLIGLAPVLPLPTDPCGVGSMLSFGPDPMTGESVLNLTGGSVAPEAMCMFTVDLLVPPGITPGIYSNVTNELTSSLGTGNKASDDLFVFAAPILTKEFVGDPVSAGGDVTLRFTIDNTSLTSGATDIEFLDELTDGSGGFPPDPTSGFLPFPVSVTSPPVPDPPCGAGSSLALVSVGTDRQGLELTGGNLTTGGSCTFEVTVSIPEGFPAGTYTNTTEEITATVDGMTVTGAPAMDDIVIVAAPRLLKEFTDDPVLPGGTVTLEFTLTNGDIDNTASDIAFTDDLDAVITGLASTSGTLMNVCGSGSQISGTSMLSFTGGTLAPGEDCTFTVTLQVPAGAPRGSFTNTTSNVAATVSGIAATNLPASDDLEIPALLFSKEFIDDPIIAGDTGILRFTIQNVGDENADITFFTDNLAANLPGLAATGGPSVNTCGGSLSGTTFLIYTSGSVDAGMTCTIEVEVLVPAGSNDGTYGNVTSSLSTSLGTIDPATDVLTVNSTLLQIEKAFTDDPTTPGGSVMLAFTLTNLDPAQAASAIAFTDDLGAALTGLTVTGLPIAACGGTVDAIPDAGTIDFSGGSLAAGASCMITVSLDVPGGAVDGFYTNTTSDVAGTIGGLAVRGDPASDVLEVNSTDFSFTKSFTDDPVGAGDTVTLAFTIQNLGTTDATGLSFIDDLDAVISGLASTSGTLTNVCGSGSQITGTSLLTFSSGNLAAGASCTFSVTLQVPAGATPGDFLNTTSNLTSSGLMVRGPATDNLTVFAPPGFMKAFVPDQIGPGGVSTLTFTINNSANSVDATGLDFTDNLPAGIIVVTPSNAATDCTGGTLTATNGSGTISYTGGTVAAGATCTITVDVTGDAVGEFENVSGDLTSSLGNSGPATATLTVSAPDYAIAKDDGDITAETDEPIIYTLTYANNGNADGTGVTITDTVPIGTTFDAAGSDAGWSCSNGDPAGTVCTFSVGALASGSTGNMITFAVTVDDPVAAGIDVIENTASIDDDGTNGDDPNPDDNTAMDTTPVDAEPDLSISKDDGDLTAQPGDTIPYTLTYSNEGNQDATGVTITDTVPVGTTFDAAGSTPGWSCADNDPAGTVCMYTVGALAGGGAGAMITFAVTVDNPIAAGVEEIENTATISDDESNGADPNPDDNTATDTTPVEAASDVSATKTDALLDDMDGDGQVDPGDTIGYTIVVTNDGDQNVADVVVTDTVDPNTDLICPVNPGPGTQVSCTPGAGGSFTVALTAINGGLRLLAPKASAEITFSVTVVVPFPATSSSVSNQATVDYTGENGTEQIVTDDPDTPRPRDPTVTPIDVKADLQLTKTASTLTPDFGTEVVFTLTLSNLGPANVVTGVDVRDSLPKGLSFVSTSGDYNPDTGIWDVGGVAVGSPATLTITATVDVLTPITNAAEVLRARLPDPDSTPGDGQGDDFDAVTLTPVAADLALDKRLALLTQSDDGSTARATFTLTLSNDGPSPATGVEVMEFFSGQMTLVSASPAADFDALTNTWTVGTLAAGASRVLTLVISAPTGATVINLAEVSAVDQSDPDSQPLDGRGDDFAAAVLNRGNLEIPPLAADLSLVKTASVPEPIVGEEITYVIEVANGGPFTTAGVEVTDLLPEGVALVSSSGSSDAGGCDPCSYDAATGTWTVGPLVDGETARLELVVRVESEGEITNTARITGSHLPDPDSDLSNEDPEEDDVAVAVITVGGGKATAIVRSGGEGIPVTYEIGQNYPNPFNPQTTIPFGVPVSGRVEVSVYNLLGQRVSVLFSGEVAAGRHEVVWVAQDQPTGLYLVRLEAGERTLVKRVTLVK